MATEPFLPDDVASDGDLAAPTVAAPAEGAASTLVVAGPADVAGAVLAPVEQPTGPPGPRISRAGGLSSSAARASPCTARSKTGWPTRSPPADSPLATGCRPSRTWLNGSVSAV